MTMDHLSDDVLIELIDGLLSHDEEQHTIAHVRDCPSCENRLRLLSADHERVLARPRPRYADGQIDFSGLTPRHRRGTTLPGSRMLKPVFAGAAAVAAVLIAVLLWPSRTPPPDPLAYWLPVEQETSLFRSLQAPSIRDGFLLALNAYGKRDAARALALFEAIPVDGIDTAYVVLRQLYIAGSLTAMERYDDAFHSLDLIDVSIVPQPWRRRTQWIEYVCYRRRGDDEAADGLLSSLANERGDIGERARAEQRRRNTSTENRSE